MATATAIMTNVNYLAFHGLFNDGEDIVEQIRTD